jgi:phage gp46-like protein
MAGDGWLINDDRDYELTPEGLMVRDDTIATRCRFHLLTRRGEYFANPEVGSRLHTIKITKNADAIATAMVNEALAPLVSDGSIAEVSSIRVSVGVEGQIVIEIAVLTGDRLIELGAIPLTGTIPIGERTASQRGLGAGVSSIGDAAETGLFQDPQLARGNVGYGWLINDDRDYQLTDNGLMVRDPTLSTRCRVRLLTRRGEYFADPNLGSLLHTIKITKNAEPKIRRFSQQALQDLIDDGEILAVELVRVIKRDLTLFAELTVKLPSGSVLPLSEIPLGAAA